MGACRELHAICDTSVATKYIDEPGEEVRGRLDYVIGTYAK